VTPSITIVSGSPGCGRTTLARALAAREERGLHLRSDVFYEFPAHPIDPATPAAQAQNASMMKALGRAAGAFAEDGYAVFLDGIFGPWFLPALVRELPAGVPLDYVVLQVRLDLALARVRERQGAGVSPAVAHMHRAFAALGELSRCVLDTSDLAPEAVLAEVLARRARGAFRLARETLSPAAAKPA
jgi:predicted kinase